MTGAVVVGQNVILRPDSVFAGKSPNPPSGVVGEVLSFDNEWVDILWSTFTESLNYRKDDISTVGNPPSLIGWDWNQAYIDSKNQDIGIILNRINPSSLDYDEAFSAMYAILLRSGIVPDRANFVQLLPTTFHLVTGKVVPVIVHGIIRIAFVGIRLHFIRNGIIR